MRICSRSRWRLAYAVIVVSSDTYSVAVLPVAWRSTGGVRPGALASSGDDSSQVCSPPNCRSPLCTPVRRHKSSQGPFQNRTPLRCPPRPGRDVTPGQCFGKDLEPTRIAIGAPASNSKRNSDSVGSLISLTCSRRSFIVPASWLRYKAYSSRPAQPQCPNVSQISNAPISNRRWVETDILTAKTPWSARLGGGIQ